jgi:arsenite methyltransferase
VSDRWADWIRNRRTGGDVEYEASMLEQLRAVRDRVLDNAEVDAGQTLLDVGCGDGLIAFGALERGAGEVVFADISKPLLEDCRELAAAAGMLDRCRLVEAPAEDLAAIDGACVDVVTTRSVLIYVEDKERALHEFHRVLRPGGRISLFESDQPLRDGETPLHLGLRARRRRAPGGEVERPLRALPAAKRPDGPLRRTRLARAR